ncbi:MAG TPA: hypothetical protein VJ787_09485 [Thermoleophilia bacterium]|nr:hypothetical protein [Thermoleophilia bacterium]
MASFFGSLQRLFKNNADGRFLAQILGVLAEHDPEPLRRFIVGAFADNPVKWPKGSMVTANSEGFFRTPNAKGRWDLEIVINGAERVRIEVKFDDSLTPGQLKKELEAGTKNGSHFLLLTRDPISSDEREALNKGGTRAAHKFFVDLALFLSDDTRDGRGRPSELFLDYLKERGLIMEPVDVDALERFVYRMFLPWKGSKRNQTQALVDGPEQLTALGRNLALVAADLHPYISRAATKQTSASIDIWQTPYFTLKGLRREIGAAEENRDEELNPEQRAGGYFSVTASHSLGHARNFLYLKYGFSLEAWKPGAKDFRVKTYAMIEGTEVTRNKVKNEGSRWVFSEEKSVTTKQLQQMDGYKPFFIKRFAEHALDVIRKTTTRRLVTSREFKSYLVETSRALHRIGARP